MMKKAKIIFASAVFLSFLIGLFPSCAIGVFYRSDQYRYSSHIGNNIDDIGVSLLIRGKKSHFALPPLFASFSEGAPYQIGLMFVDYDNKNKCKSVEITEFILTYNGQEYDILKGTPKSYFPFRTYVEGVSHMKIECLLEAGDWLTADLQNKIEFRVKFKIYKKGSSVESGFNGEVQSNVIKGFGSIFDIY